MANNPDIITSDWKTSVHTTVFIPPYVIVIKHCVATLVIKTFQHNMGFFFNVKKIKLFMVLSKCANKIINKAENYTLYYIISE
jgi:hypothetical protein